MRPLPETSVAAHVAIDFKAVFDAAPTPLMVLSPDFTIVEVNDLYTTTVGRDRDHLIGRNVFDAFPGDTLDGGQLRNSLDRVVATGKVDLLPVLPYALSFEDGEPRRAILELFARADPRRRGSADVHPAADAGRHGDPRRRRPPGSGVGSHRDQRAGPCGARAGPQRVAPRGERTAAQSLHALAELHVSVERTRLSVRAGQSRLQRARRTARIGRADLPGGDSRGRGSALPRHARQGLFDGRGLRRQADAGRVRAGAGCAAAGGVHLLRVPAHRRRQWGGLRHLRRRQRCHRSRSRREVPGASGARVAPPSSQHPGDRPRCG